MVKVSFFVKPVVSQKNIRSKIPNKTEMYNRIGTWQNEYIRNLGT